jgi:hypothetical protein
MVCADNWLTQKKANRKIEKGLIVNFISMYYLKENIGLKVQKRRNRV